MMQTTTWSPDTCDCQFEYEWDDQIDVSLRVHSFKNALKICDAHSGLDGVTAYEHICKENTTKNIVYGKILDSFPEFVDAKQVKGQINKKLKEGIDYNWKFVGNDDQREIQVFLSGDQVDKKVQVDTTGLDKNVTFL